MSIMHRSGRIKATEFLAGSTSPGHVRTRRGKAILLTGTPPLLMPSRNTTADIKSNSVMAYVSRIFINIEQGEWWIDGRKSSLNVQGRIKRKISHRDIDTS